MSSATTYAESVASCRAPTPIPSPSPAAAAALPDAPPLPVRRQLDFQGGGGGGGDNLQDDDDDDFLFRAAEEMERDLKRRPSQGLTLQPTPPFPQKQCTCGRGPCSVERKEPRGWAYVCSALPKCKHSAYCEESDDNPKSQPAFGSHPEPKNPLVFTTQRNRMANATTQVNVSPQGAGDITQVTVTPQGAGATTPVNFGSHPEPKNPLVFTTQRNRMANATTQVNVSPQGVGAITQVTVSPQGAGATTPVNFSPQGAKSSGVPTCKCTAGICRTAKEKGVLYYVCHIQKGQGACSHREPVDAAAEEVPLTGYNNPRETEHLVYNPDTNEANGHNIVMMGAHNETRPFNPDEPPEYDDWPFDIVEGDVVPTDCFSPAHPSSIPVVARGSPIMLQQPVGIVELETPTKSPMPPKYTISPTTRRSKDCHRCGEEGHFTVNCPKNTTCHNCNVAGHWVKDCPKLHSNTS